jgi:uracil-DNA glycosylase family 4
VTHLQILQDEITACRACPRLVRWRESVAREKVRRFRQEDYWGKPVPGFGDRNARLLIVGLAPAAHGANRTGRMFTGDESGTWLYRAMHKAGFSSHALSMHRDDGMTLTDCYITATVRCVPPQNRPTAKEVSRCRQFLLREIGLLKNVRVVIGLGRIGFDTALNAYREVGRVSFHQRPLFAHAAEYSFDGLTFIASYHPSQQNTFTGKLTRAMLDAVFLKARKLLGVASRENVDKVKGE